MNASDPFGAIRRLWLERAAGIGQDGERSDCPRARRSGMFEGLDRFGRLQLKSADGVELIDAGDLYFPNLLHDIAKPDAGTKRF